MKKILTFLLTIALFSCSIQYYKETEKLNSLLEKLGKKIPKQHHIYLLQSGLSCSGCMQIVFNHIDETVARNNVNNITLIGVFKEKVPSRLLSNVEFIVDTNSIVDEIFYKSVNLTLIKTFDCQVVKYEVLKTSDVTINSTIVNSFFREGSSYLNR